MAITPQQIDNIIAAIAGINTSVANIAGRLAQPAPPRDPWPGNRPAPSAAAQAAAGEFHRRRNGGPYGVFTAAAADQTHVDLSWTVDSGWTLKEILRSTGPAYANPAALALPQNVNGAHTDATVVANTAYRYKLVMVSGTRQSEIVADVNTPA